MEIKNILVPIDFSECSKNALRKAIKLAKRANAKIHMVNAVHIHTPHANFSAAALLDSLIADYESQVKQSFDELESEIIELKDIPHEADQFVAYLADAIQAEIQAKEIDLIVMGTRSEHEKVESFIGTNTTDIIESVHIPMIVVPEKYEGSGFKKIAFAADLKKINDLGSLENLKTIALLYGAEVLAFHVEEEPFEISNAEEAHIKIINDKLEGVKSSIRTVAANDIVDGITDFIKQHNIDMLAMIPRKHTLFEKLFSKSITKSIALDPEIPVFVFHDV
ncbi:MAG: nucleotide-binding universal stress UspA family protein [Cyclobacteriaceae bacterium]|jgi:nucleotide-binding universal stress UspA family protein